MEAFTPSLRLMHCARGSLCGLGIVLSICCSQCCRPWPCSSVSARVGPSKEKMAQK